MEHMAGWPQSLLIGIAAALATAAVIGLLFRGRIAGKEVQSGTPAEAEAFRTANVELERRLAVAEHRSSMLADLERKLADATVKVEAVAQAKSGVEAALAASKGAASGQVTEMQGLRDRLAASERTVSAHARSLINAAALAFATGALTSANQINGGAEAP